MGSRRDRELLSREVDELLLQAERGVSRDELDAHTDELERVRARLAATVQGGAQSLGDAA